ncbi:uncharacterized protein LOC116618245 [Nematostella vectensis]|uniref:uncharacterized protein LOC116618245 n=1 Tax=Nematostella vectensis TaxID=45351 RepID=UPI0020778930|nr:uncharacterized protein LOC116618245 [Nematostella vectensis]
MEILILPTRHVLRLLLLAFVILPASSIICSQCQPNAMLDVTCANKTTVGPCGNDPNGRAYNACYTTSKVEDFPFVGVRFSQEKGCAFKAECNFLRTIKCDDIDGFLKSCELSCCTGDNCNEALSLGMSELSTGATISMESQQEMTSSMFPTHAQTVGISPTTSSSAVAPSSVVSQPTNETLPTVGKSSADGMMTSRCLVTGMVFTIYRVLRDML